MSAGSLDRAALPSWEAYARQHDMTLRGRGDEKRTPCTIHGGERDSLCINVESGKWHCHACGAVGGDVLGFHMQHTGLAFEEAARDLGAWRDGEAPKQTRAERAELARQIEAATRERERQQRERWADNAKRIDRLWRECVPLAPACPGARHLTRRVGGVWPLPACLRLHRALPYWDDTGAKLGEFPAMVAPLTAPDGRMVALHRTYLTADGRKAGVPSVKKLTGTAGPLAGACIPLFKPERGVIGIAEGIETALAAWCASGVPTVAAYCAGNLAAWQWAAGVQRVVVFADNDKAGREAADKLRTRVRAARLRCDVMLPTDEGSDWADVWAEGAIPAASAATAAIERARA